jgi:hypothetical protein
MPGIMKTGMVRRFGSGGDVVAESAWRTLLLSYGPSLYWPLDAVYGADDQSAGGTNDGTAVGPTIGGHTATSPPIVGEDVSCTDLDGSDDRITSAYACYVANSTRTWLGWAYRDTSDTADALFGSTAAGGQNVRQRMPAASTNFTFVQDTTGGVVTSWVGAWPGDTQWVFWVLVYDDSVTTDNITLYINGSAVSTQSNSGNYDASPGNFNLGSATGTTDPFNGKMGHIAVVEGALNATQVSDLYVARLG